MLFLIADPPYAVQVVFLSCLDHWQFPAQNPKTFLIPLAIPLVYSMLHETVKEM